MQMCPYCEKAYDESEYSRCPHCPSKSELSITEKIYKNCLKCGGIMYWDDYWLCSNCGNEIYTSEDDNDGVIEYQ